jgi:retron-type reverse transcriptase
VFEQLASWDNLLLAYERAARRKRGRAEVAAFEYRLEDNLLALRAELTAGTYRPGPYRRFYVHQPKHRLVAAAPFRDRVVHHALCQCIEPLFEPAFVPDSYANRVGKGTHRALARARQLTRRFPYVLQLDVRRFFPSIDHALLRRRECLRRRLRCASIPPADTFRWSRTWQPSSSATSPMT